jgi:hypothetical protein
MQKAPQGLGVGKAGFTVGQGFHAGRQCRDAVAVRFYQAFVAPLQAFLKGWGLFMLRAFSMFLFCVDTYAQGVDLAKAKYAHPQHPHG